MKKKFNIVVLASGNGTNLGAIIEAKKEGRLKNVNLLGVISNRMSGALEKARDFGCPAIYLPVNDSDTGKIIEDYDRKLLAEIKKLEQIAVKKAGKPVRVDLICLIGWMRILSPEFIHAFPEKIINVHPALLPNYGGKGMYGDKVHAAVLDSGEKETGMTIHYVTEDVDSGEILLQKKCAIAQNETIISLKAKVQSLEKEGYVETLEKLSG